MDTIFMNSGNSKTSDPHRWLLNLSDKINLKRSDNYIALSRLSICYTCKNIKMSYKTINLKYQLWHRMKSLNYLMDHIQDYIFRYSEFSYIEAWFTDQNSKSLEIQNKKNITLVIN